MSWIAKTEPGAVSRWVDVDVVVAVVREGNRVTDCDTHVVVGLDGPLCMKFRQITPIVSELHCRGLKIVVHSALQQTKSHAVPCEPRSVSQ